MTKKATAAPMDEHRPARLDGAMAEVAPESVAQPFRDDLAAAEVDRCALSRRAVHDARSVITMRIPFFGRSVMRCTGSTRVSGHEIEAERLHEMRERDDAFAHRKALSDAHARPRAERDIGEAVDLLALRAEEARGIETVGIAPQRAGAGAAGKARQ